jgi:hypothetical protein
MQRAVTGEGGESSPRRPPEKRYEIRLAAETRRRGGLWRLVLAAARSGETGNRGRRTGVALLVGLFKYGLGMRFWAGRRRGDMHTLDQIHFFLETHFTHTHLHSSL